MTRSTAPASTEPLEAAPAQRRAPRAAAAPRGAAAVLEDPAQASLLAAAEPASYEEALAELDELVAKMEQGQLPLDRLLHDYKRGAELLAYCKGRLEAVEQQVRLLEEGRLKPWSAA